MLGVQDHWRGDNRRSRAAARRYCSNSYSSWKTSGSAGRHPRFDRSRSGGRGSAGPQSLFPSPQPSPSGRGRLLSNVLSKCSSRGVRTTGTATWTCRRLRSEFRHSLSPSRNDSVEKERSPSPLPSPQGEGELLPALEKAHRLVKSQRARKRVPSPRGRGTGPVAPKRSEGG